MRKRRYTTISNFICPDCSNVIPLPRSHGNQREKGHIKTLYCPFCKSEKDFKEMKRKECYISLAGDVIYV